MQRDTSQRDNSGRPVKLSCRQLWKTYGSNLGAAFDAERAKSHPEEVASALAAAGQFPAVIDASFDIHQGEIFVIMGLSGSGKSTLIRCLSRLIEPSSGAVLLDDEDLLRASPERLIELRRHAMGMVFQNFGLLPHLSVLENVAFPLRIQGMPLDQRLRRAQEMVTLVGLKGRETSKPHQLSGGQQQRIGIARSLAVEPALWFLDEPFSALDPLTRRQMQDEFLRLQRMLSKTIVFITHDIAEACRLGDRIAIMRQGRIVQIGKPAEIVLKPADPYVAAFTEDVPLAHVVKAADLLPGDATPDAAAPQGPVIMADTRLESLLAPLASGVSAFTVQDADGRLLGTLPAATALAALEPRSQGRASA
ncbi:MAG TPA: ATP-binding cassette domain-containing protein [Terriglobales bacterium]|nr:ATP-binding cassette domain-containing protein [Terriglobales bacterium]